MRLLAAGRNLGSRLISTVVAGVGAKSVKESGLPVLERLHFVAEKRGGKLGLVGVCDVRVLF